MPDRLAGFGGEDGEARRGARVAENSFNQARHLVSAVSAKRQAVKVQDISQIGF